MTAFVFGLPEKVIKLKTCLFFCREGLICCMQLYVIKIIMCVQEKIKCVVICNSACCHRNYDMHPNIVETFYKPFLCVAQRVDASYFL